jgi:hypothetical protein
MKPFSTYPEDRAKLLELSRVVATSGDAEDAEKAADELADLVSAIISDESVIADMAKMTEEQADEIGQLADRLDTILYSVKLPVSSAIHIQGMSGVIRDVRNELVRIVRANLSYDPWADQDFA